METTASNIVEAVELANKVRSASWNPFKRKLKDLPEGKPQQPKECVLAKAFNFGCHVNHNRYEGWYVVFPKSKKKYARKLADLVDRMMFGTSDGWKVRLPDRIGQIAKDFDMRRLDDKYYART